MEAIVAGELRKRCRCAQALDGASFAVGAGELFAAFASFRRSL